MYICICLLTHLSIHLNIALITIANIIYRQEYSFTTQANTLLSSALSQLEPSPETPASDDEGSENESEGSDFAAFNAVSIVAIV